MNEARLKLMRKDGVILNFARAPIVDEKSIISALDAGRLQGYVCDFPSNATKDHPPDRHPAAPRRLHQTKPKTIAPSWWRTRSRITWKTATSRTA